MADVALTTIPGFSDLSAVPLAADKLSLGVHLNRINLNAAFGLVRMEVFHGNYRNGDTVPLPISVVDGYQYKRNELTYLWMVANTINPDTGWATDGEPWTMWYGIWNVIQASGVVTSEVGYRGNQDYPNRQDVSKDGWITVIVIGQRQKSTMLMSAQPAFNKHLDTDFYTDRAVNTGLMTDFNANAKFACVNTEVIYMGEFSNGQTVPQPISPVDGKVYAYGNVKFMHAWRWTADTDGGGNPVKPAISKGQLDDWQASVSGTGVVSLSTFYESYGRHTYNTGKVAVFAFCSRPIGTTFAAPQNLFAEIFDNVFYPGSTLRASTMKQLNWNINHAVMAPEIFGPVDYSNGNTVSLPTSPIDGYVYTRAELSYAFDWSNTGNGGDNGRMVVSQGSIGATGVVSIFHYRLPDGASSSRFSTEGTLRVITIAKRRVTHLPMEQTTDLPPDWLSDARGDDPTGPLYGNNLLPNFSFEEVSQSTGVATDAQHWVHNAASPTKMSSQRAAVPAAASANIIVSDTFTGAAGELQNTHLPETGFRWIASIATVGLKIDGAGKLVQVGASASAVQLYQANPHPNADGYSVQLDVNLGTSVIHDTGIGVVVRQRDGNNYYHILVWGDGNITLAKVIAGVTTTLQNSFLAGGTAPVGTLKVVVFQHTFQIYWNGVLKATWTDASLLFQANEWAGVLFFVPNTTTGYSADNFIQKDTLSPAAMVGSWALLQRLEANQSIGAGVTYTAEEDSDVQIPIEDGASFAVRVKAVAVRDTFSLLTDTFTDTAATLLSAHVQSPSGLTWARVETGQDMKIGAGGANVVLTTATTPKVSYQFSQPPQSHYHTVYCDLDISASAANADNIGIHVMFKDINNYIYVSIRGNGVLRIEHKVAGVTSTILADTAIVGKTGTLKVQVLPVSGGVQVIAFWNGTNIGAVNDASLGAFANYKVGIGGGSVAAISFDNFSLDSFFSCPGITAHQTGIILTAQRLDGTQVLIARRIVTLTPNLTKYLSCAGVIPITGPNDSPWAYATFRIFTSITNTAAVAVTTPNGHDYDVYYDDIDLIRMTNLAGHELMMRGNLPEGYVGSMAYSATTVSLTWTWSLSFLRTDIDLQVETLSGSQLLSSLTAGTYNHYPYMDENGVDPFVDMVRTGGIGAPSWAHVGTDRSWTAEQARADHVALSLAPLPATVPAAGTGGGTGGGDGTCLRWDVLVEDRELGVVRLGDLSVGWHWLACAVAEDTPDGWVRSYVREKKAHFEWVHTEFGDGDGGVLDWVPASEYHPWTLVDGTRRTSLQLTLVDIMRCRTGITPVVGNTLKSYADYKVAVECDSIAHTFWCGMNKPQIENHNMNPGT
jgi:hypothetical protein